MWNFSCQVRPDARAILYETAPSLFSLSSLCAGDILRLFRRLRRLRAGLIRLARHAARERRHAPPGADEEGEDLFGDDYLHDYRAQPELDVYERRGLDENYVEEMDLAEQLAARRAADEELDMR